MPNRLQQETSPYLLQHADNPVDWHPWNETALHAARENRKPILLSIGYSACHWCHVMAHESFENEATARVMNEHFVNIKVDREERPDLDKIYQTAHQLLTQQTGGWPLTMFLDPETLVPFFGGTYFPNTARFQLPSFVDLLLRINDVFENKREELQEQGKRVMEVIANLNPTSGRGVMEDTELLAKARQQLGEQYDNTDGGFGGAPKFPMPTSLNRVLRHRTYQERSGEPDREALDMVMTTLTKMARGGIYDHLGGGFCRYATDRKWMVPHFEKMLYDNGQLLSLYADALSIAPDALLTGAVVETAEWLLREMRHPDGAFFAALDADSEGEEGKFYVWQRHHIKALLSEDEYLVIETLYGIDKPANFENSWNLHRYDSWRSVVQRLSLDPDTAVGLLKSAKQKLFEERATRIRPGLDDKILMSWNGLAIKGLTKAGLVLGEPRWIDAANQALDFIRAQAWQNGTLYATWKDGKAKHPGYLDDYANVLDALLTSLQTEWRDDYAKFAIELADKVFASFYDNDNGGFFFTAHEHEALIHRPKPTMDDAQPPGNGIIAQVLNRLGHLLGNADYIDASINTLVWARALIERYPAGHCSLLGALEEQVYPQQLVILRGPAADIDAWRAELTKGYCPWRNVYPIPYSANVLPTYLPRLVSADHQTRPSAYVCSGLSCSLPIDSLDALKANLES